MKNCYKIVDIQTKEIEHTEVDEDFIIEMANDIFLDDPEVEFSTFEEAKKGLLDSQYKVIKMDSEG